MEIEPYTLMDKLEAEGVLYAPQDAKEQNTPIATTGIVIQLSEEFMGNRKIITEGSCVMFGPYAGENVKFSDNCQLRILDEAQLICTVVSDSDNLLASVIAPTIKAKLGVDILQSAA